MRIISGTFRGRRLDPGRNFTGRPTTDQAKESLFNILENNFNMDELTVLDLFAGTGSISMEFISRGCIHATAVEMNFRHFSYIRNLPELFKIDNLSVHKMDAYKFLGSCSGQFDIIFADPPYEMKDTARISELVHERNLLKEGGWLIIEHPADLNFREVQGFFDHRKYGDVNFSFFE